jgi:hypothetical protein
VYNHFRKTPIEKIHTDQLIVLEICQHIHKLAEEFYQYLAGIHQAHPEISRMWGLLAIDKCNHSDTFKMATRLKGQGISAINVSSEAAANILTKMKAIPKNERQHTPSVVDALRFAVTMEENLNSIYFMNVVKFFSAQDTALMVSSLKSNSSILHMMTEEFMNLTVLGSEGFE